MAKRYRPTVLTFAISIEVMPAVPNMYPWPTPGQMFETVKAALEERGLQILEGAVGQVHVTKTP